MFTHRDRAAGRPAPGRAPGVRNAQQGPQPHAERLAQGAGAGRPLSPAGLRAMQAGAGNAAAVDAVGRQRAVQRADSDSSSSGGASDAATTAAPPRYRIQIQTTKNSRTHHLDYWANLALGHAWVALYKEEGGQSTWKSYGFFPAENVPHNKPFTSVQGVVKRNHDSPDNASSKLTAELTEEQYNNAREFIRSSEGREYNLATFNCTTFARAAFTAATGESAPGLGMPLLENPNTLQDSIKRRNDKSGAPRKGEDIAADMGPNSDYDSDSSDDSWSNPLGGFRQMNQPDPAAAAAAPARPRFVID
ncbi:hypothetical protein [Streptomyces sp. NPDC090025]|uniref:hypothetical protein n=1 Tax=Streptomyces sp. NPDC090025 TaxID=3365922 RepID=UPI0038328C9D